MKRNHCEPQQSRERALLHHMETTFQHITTSKIVTITRHVFPRLLSIRQQPILPQQPNKNPNPLRCLLLANQPPNISKPDTVPLIQISKRFRCGKNVSLHPFPS